MDRACSMYGAIQKYIQNFDGKTWGKETFRGPRRIWEDDFKMDLKEVGCDTGDWTDLAQNRDWLRAYVRAVMNLEIP